MKPTGKMGNRASEQEQEVAGLDVARDEHTRELGGGEFFTVDRRSFAAACTLGLNPAVAYLVLARGAGSRKTSLWSVNAVERYTGISRSKAKVAIETLRDNHIITFKKGGTSPTYGIVPAHGEPQRVFLPNAIIEGAADEAPPLALLRQMQDVRRLQLFVTLYDNSDLPNDGGVSRSILRQELTTTKVSQRGASTVWAFADYEPVTSGSSLYGLFLTGKNEGGEDTGMPEFWSAIEAFLNCGLIKFIPHVFESDKPEAEMLHAYAVDEDGSEPWERSVASAAHIAAFSCLVPAQQEWASQESRHLLVAPSHISKLAVIGIARLRYRPQTRMTAAWFAKSRERSMEWEMTYDTIAGNNTDAPRTIAT